MLSLERMPAGKRLQKVTTAVTKGAVALAFAFYVQYLPIHLLSEPHLDGTQPASLLVFAEHDDHRDPDPGDADYDHHKPHPASAHAVHALPRSGSVPASLAFVPPDEPVVVVRPESPATRSFPEPVQRPGESTPRPRQSRAPPSA